MIKVSQSAHWKLGSYCQIKMGRDHFAVRVDVMMLGAEGMITRNNCAVSTVVLEGYH